MKKKESIGWGIGLFIGAILYQFFLGKIMTSVLQVLYALNLDFFEIILPVALIIATIIEMKELVKYLKQRIIIRIFHIIPLVYVCLNTLALVVLWYQNC